MNYHLIPEIDFYRIKVNKKGNNNISINLRKKMLREGNISNSEEKNRKNNLHIKCIEENILQKEGNILDDLINNRYLKPILESQDIDEKLLNCNLKEPVRNNFNVSLNDFFNRRKKYYMNFKTPKTEMNQSRGLLINTHNISNDYYFKNDISSSAIHNKTMENHFFNQNNNNINNYYNDIQMTNNYYNNYNNNEINILNPPYYNINNNKKMNNLCSSVVRKKIKKYLSSYNSNKRNNLSNKIPSPNLHFFKSQTYSQKENNYTETYYKNKNDRIIRNKINKEINIRNLTNEIIDKDNDSYVKDGINNKYNDIKNIIKHNNKYDYNKKLFDIYRGKLIKEFLRHIQIFLNKYFLKLFRFFVEQINNKKYLNKIDEIFIPKIHLEKPNKNMINNSANTTHYLQIFNSDKKKYQRNNNSKITQYKKYRNRSNINNSAIISQRQLIINGNKINRNSLIPSISKNNIQIIKMSPNNNNSNIIYKKKKIDKNHICIKKNKNNILSNSRGKIIDIDINLGKPLRDISDINPLESKFYKNNNKNIKFRSSFSTNKREKKKRKNRSKNKILSLPKKKYLEEKYDSSSEKDNIENNDNSFENNLINTNFTIKTNNNIIQPFIFKSSRVTYNRNKINKITWENSDKNILVRNIETSDRRLFIHMKYLSNILDDNKLRTKLKYEKNTLIIKRNIYFPLFGQNIIKNNNKDLNHSLENNKKKLNGDNYMNNDKNKYLYSCVKFVIKNINKVFLKKAFKIFINEYEIKCKNKKEENNKENKYRINTYKKKIRGNKNVK